MRDYTFNETIRSSIFERIWVKTLNANDEHKLKNLFFLSGGLTIRVGSEAHFKVQPSVKRGGTRSTTNSDFRLKFQFLSNVY